MVLVYGDFYQNMEYPYTSVYIWDGLVFGSLLSYKNHEGCLLSILKSVPCPRSVLVIGPIKQGKGRGGEG